MKILILSFLRKHMAAVHEGVRYPCDKCDYSSTRKAQLKDHDNFKERIIQLNTADEIFIYFNELLRTAGEEPRMTITDNRSFLLSWPRPSISDDGTSMNMECKTLNVNVCYQRYAVHKQWYEWHRVQDLHDHRLKEYELCVT